MSDRAKGSLVWGDTSATPVEATTLSKCFNYRADSKFIQLSSQYDAWADFVITGLWPDATSLTSVNKVFYNSTTREAKMLMPKPDSNSVQYWKTVASPYGKLLSLKPFTQISANYYNVKISQYVYECFDFGESIKYFSIDDIIATGGVSLEVDYIPSQRYCIVLYHASIYDNSATIKIVRDGTDISWQKGNANGLSPSGYSVVSYRKIGGFTTDSVGMIIENSIWDLSTFSQEILTKKINIQHTDNSISPLKATDIPIVNSNNIFSYTDVEGALYETRTVVDNLRNKFYSNKRFGVELKFSPIWPVEGTYQTIPTNGITLKITPGFIDVSGTEISIGSDVFLNGSSIRINNSTTFTTNASLGGQDQSGIKIYPGIWRVYITPAGKFVLKHESVSGGPPIFSPSFFGWYDTTEGNRCLGKFRVKLVSGKYFIEKMSVTQTLEENIPTNTIRMFHGTICPDGLLPCDGLWHDINGYDQNAYTLAQINSDPNIGNFRWGSSWYEETPNLKKQLLRMTDGSSIETVLSGFSFATGAGGSADTGASGGSETHTHDHIHTHDSGTFNIIASGAHSNHSINFSGETTWTNTDGTGGQRVSLSTHTHSVTISGGEHAHLSESFLGNTGSLSGGAQTTTSTSSYAPYKDIIFCIRK